MSQLKSTQKISVIKIFIQSKRLYIKSKTLIIPKKNEQNVICRSNIYETPCYLETTNLITRSKESYRKMNSTKEQNLPSSM
jgi:hypothetical protein